MISAQLITTIRQARTELARRSLAEFVRQAWPIIEPATPLLWNWHLDLICAALERQSRGDLEYRKLLICVPPGSMKSLLVSVFQPAWQWLQEPSRRKLFFANADSLAVRDSRRMRAVITSDWYREIRSYCGQTWTLAHDQNEKVNFANTLHGSRECLSIGATVTGKRADDIVIDDPIDAKDVINGSSQQIADRLENVANIIDAALPNRVNDLPTARWTIIMQRLHENDPAGRAIAEGDWKLVNLQMEFDPANTHNHPDDPRRTAGELLFATKFPSDSIVTLKRQLGARHYSAQYQQKPVPAEGSIIREGWLRYWDVLPKRFDQINISADLAFKGNADSDYVAIGVWGAHGSRDYLLDQVRGQYDFPQTLERLAFLIDKYHPSAVLIEDAANGPAIISTLKSRVPGLIAIKPEGGKEARANAVAPRFEAGDVWLPKDALWLADYVSELLHFPRGRNDDQVDQTTQYLNWRSNSSLSRLLDLARI